MKIERELDSKNCSFSPNIVPRSGIQTARATNTKAKKISTSPHKAYGAASNNDLHGVYESNLGGAKALNTERKVTGGMSAIKSGGKSARGTSTKKKPVGDRLTEKREPRKRHSPVKPQDPPTYQPLVNRKS